MGLGCKTRFLQSLIQGAFVKKKAELPPRKDFSKGLKKALFQRMGKSTKKPPFSGIFKFKENTRAFMAKNRLSALTPEIRKPFPPSR